MVRRYTMSAVMVAAVVGSVTLAGRDGAPERAGAAAGSTASAPASAPAEMICPESIPAVVVRGVPSVPEPPRGFDGTQRLTPQDTPASALVCRYATKPNSSPLRPEARDALNGSVRLSGDLGALARELAWTPHQDSSQGCTQVGGPMRGYLLGLTYGDGRRVWVGGTEEVNGCAGAGNGAFTTGEYLGGRLAAAYRTQVWQDVVTPAVADPCGQEGWRAYGGRLGGGPIPEGVTQVIVCDEKAAGEARPVALREEQWRPLLDRLRALPTLAEERPCSARADGPLRILRIGYADGPGVTAWLMPGCDVRMDGGRLVAVDADGGFRRAVDEAVHNAATNPGPAPATPAAPPSCPTRRGVPAAMGLDPRDRLVPVTTPDAAVTCAYGRTGQLVRTKPLTSGFERLARDLPWLPRRTDALACVPIWTTPAGSAAASYLIGLRYGDGVLWLDAGSPPRGRRCTPATNGSFVARTSLYGATAHAHAAGAWQGLGSSVAGRLGDDRVLVPAGVPATVNVRNGTRWGTATTAQAVAITRALRGLPARPVATGLSAWSGVTNGYGVSLDYGFGPPVVLNVVGNSISSAALRASLTPVQSRRLVGMLEAVLPPR